MNKVEEFNAYREKMNDKILGSENLVLKRLFNLDSNTYSDGALRSQVKEMLGLVASMVLRCDDCVKYHLEKCKQQNVSDAELFEVLSQDQSPLLQYKSQQTRPQRLLNQDAYKRNQVQVQ
jgi:AhpD family alkylhydroperoxidase